jgi:hypothetical protein
LALPQAIGAGSRVGRYMTRAVTGGRGDEVIGLARTNLFRCLMSDHG